MSGKTREAPLGITVNHQAYEITTQTCHLVDELESDHQEADTRMLLHAKHDSSTYDNIVISTPDTDVFMIALAMLSDIDAHLYLLTGTKDKRRVINLNAVSEDVNEKFNKSDCAKTFFMSALLGFHGFTGCDTTSAFGGRGKVKPLQLLGSCPEYKRSHPLVHQWKLTRKCFG